MAHRDSRHHRKCRSNGGTNENRNISLVSRKEHQSFHTLFENKDAYSIAKILNDVWIDPEYEFIVRKRG